MVVRNIVQRMHSNGADQPFPVPTVEWVSPEQAMAWLEVHDASATTWGMQNRQLSAANHKKLVAEIVEGRWDPTKGEPIRFDKNGVLCDGQHRLWAVVEAEQGVWMYVLRGVDREHFREDEIPSRNFSLADYLHMHGVRNEKMLAAIVNHIHRYQVYGRFATHGGDVPIPRREALALIEKHPELYEIARVTVRTPYGPLAVQAPLLAALYWLFSQSDPHDADDFIDRLGTGIPQFDGDPVLAVRNKLLQYSQELKRARPEPNVAATYIIKGWNAYRAGKSVMRLQYRASEGVPQIE